MGASVAQVASKQRMIRAPTLFWFPRNVSEVAARFVGAQVVIVCILIIIFRKERGAHYLTLAQGIDFLLRLFGGGRMSIQGSIADLFAWYFHRKLTPGPPKQFAAFCGLFFCIIGTIVAFTDDSGTGLAIVMAMLAGAAFLESVLNFCAGCFIFKYLVRFGIVPQHVISRVNDTYDEAWAVMEFEDRRLNEGPQQEKVLAIADSKLPFHYKRKTDDQSKEDFNPVKHCDITYYGAVMGLTGLAVVWKSIEQVFDYPAGIWHTLIIFSFVLFSFVTILYAIRAVFYYNKILKEWDHPVKRNFFACIPINILLYGLASVGWDDDLAEVLFWIGAVMILYLGVSAVHTWILVSHYKDHLNPSWMIPVVGNLVAAILAPQVNPPNNNEVAWLWFSFGYFMWLALFPITFYRIVFEAQVIERLRSSLWIFVAAPSVATSAYIAVNGGIWDNFARYNFYAAIGLWGVLALLTYSRYFGYHKFEMGYWGYAFPLDTLALVTIQYHSFVDTGVTEVVAIVAICIATFVNAMCFIHTVILLTRRKMFIPDDKWGPTSMMRLVHEGLKEAVKKLIKLLDGIKKDPSQSEKIDQFIDLFLKLKLIHHEHAVHEDEVQFPQLRSFFPPTKPNASTQAADEQHERDHKEFHRIAEKISALKKTSDTKEREKIIEKLVPRIERLSGNILEHLRTEEDDLNPIGKKFLSLKTQKQVIRQVWEITPIEKWNVFIPFIIQQLPYPGQRIRFLKSFTWALPEKAQVIGRMVYDNVPLDLWDRITEDAPEFIPRGLSGYVRYY